MKKSLWVILVLAFALVMIAPAFAQDAASLPTIADTLAAAADGSSPEFTTLLAAIKVADPVLLEKLSDPNANLILFAPTDAAFAALTEKLGQDIFSFEGTVWLDYILQYHVLDVSASFRSSTHMHAAEIATGIQQVGGVLGMQALSGDMLDLASPDGSQLTVDENPIAKADWEASNGMIQVIDQVLVPFHFTFETAITQVASSDPADFTVLQKALLAADFSVFTKLVDPTANLVFFAPLDSAFAQYSEEELNQLIGDSARLTDLLLGHIYEWPSSSPGTRMILSKMGSSLQSSPITLTALNGQPLKLASADGITVTVNDVPIATSLKVLNGRIEAVQTLLTANTATIADTLMSRMLDTGNPQSISLIALAVIGTEDMLATLSDTSAQYTFFAPTDAAFAALGQETVDKLLGDPANVAELLQHLTVPGVLTNLDLTMMAIGEKSFDTLLEDQLTITGSMGDDGKSYLMVDGAKLIVTDIVASNGIIHLLDAVPLPEE